jgi:ABC-type Fe3+ transport system permease subunit
MGNPSIYERIESNRSGIARLKVRSVVTLMVAVCLSMTAMVIWEAWSSRQYHLRDKEVAMSNLARKRKHRSSKRIRCCLPWSIASKTTV